MLKPLAAIAAAAFLSAALFLAVIGGTLGAVILAYMAPLPLYVLGLAMGFRSAAIAAAVSGLAIALTAAPLAGLGFVGAVGLPAAILMQRALLARQDSNGGDLEWYPTGLLTLWWCGLAAVAMVAGAVLLGNGDIQGTVRDLLDQSLAFWLRGIDNPAVSGRQSEMVAMMAPSFPAMVAVSWALMHALNAILAQGLLVRFGRNLRPSPRLAEVNLPKTALAALVACAIGGMVLPGDIGYLASNLVIIAALPYFIAGLGLAHAAAARTGWSTAWLVALYFGLVTMLTWMAPALVVAGIADQWLGLRARLGGAGSPPSGNPPTAKIEDDSVDPNDRPRD